VFEVMLEKATTLCEAAFGILWTHDGTNFRAVAFRNVPQPYVDFLREPPPVGPETPLGRIAAGEALVQIADQKHILGLGSPLIRQSVELGGFRTVLCVGLRKDALLLGAFTIYRQEVRPFSDKQIALLRNFAAQAVIAMENARLITETREALEQQQAIAEVLQVINSSRGDLQPVFDILLEKAMQLCGAAFGALAVAEGNTARNVAVRGAPAFAEFRRHNPSPNTPGSIAARWLSGEPVVHIADVKDDDLYRHGDPYRRALVDLGGARSVLYVGLQKEGKVLGAISIFRQEVRPFSENEIALLQSFAAQAVIAMDNARLLDEIRQRVALPRGIAISSRSSTCPTHSSPSGRALPNISAIWPSVVSSSQLISKRN
jgi:GAF domain-containing protein